MQCPNCGDAMESERGYGRPEHSCPSCSFTGDAECVADVAKLRADWQERGDRIAELTREVARLKVSAREYAQVASAIGIAYEADGMDTQPGPVERVIEAVRELQAARDEVARPASGQESCESCSGHGCWMCKYGVARERARAEALECVLRSLASYVGSGGLNAPTVEPAEFEAKVRWGIDYNVDVQTKRVATLEAEVARLKTPGVVLEMAEGLLRDAQVPRVDILHPQSVNVWFGRDPVNRAFMSSLSAVARRKGDV